MQWSGVDDGLNLYYHNLMSVFLSSLCALVYASYCWTTIGTMVLPQNLFKLKQSSSSSDSLETDCPLSLLILKAFSSREAYWFSNLF